MKGHNLHKALLVICVCVLSEIRAQYHSQMGLGNYGSVHSLYLNPSSHAYSAWLWQVNLAGFWGNVNNNYLSLRLPYSAYRIPNRIPGTYLTESGNPQFRNEWVQERLNGSNKFATVSTDVYGPSASVKIKSWRLGVFTHGAASLRTNGVNEALAHAVFKSMDSAQGAFSLFDLNSTGNNHIDAFNITANSRAEAGINLAKTFQLDYKRQLTAGISIKKVFGFQGFHFYSSDLDVTSVNQDSLFVHPGSMHLVTYGNTPGQGMGVDIGATYVFHKKDNRRNGAYAKNHTRYFSKIGLSVMDIGSVNYKDAVFRDVSINGAGVGINTAGSSYNNISNYEQAIDTFMSEFASYSSRKGSHRVGLPTRILVSGDFQLRRNIYLGSLISQSLRSRASGHARYQSYMMLSPRIELRYFEMSIPLMLQYDYRSLRMGASFRVGPLYFGTNSLMSFVNTRNFKDVDIFAGIAFGNLEAFSFSKQVRKKIKQLWRPGSSKSSCFSF